jgi:hypothetical protein
MNKVKQNQCINIYYALTVMMVMVFGGTISAAEAGERLGQEIPEKASIVKLVSVVINPADYDGKTIVLKGTVSSICASRCHFNFQDGVHTVAVYPRGFKLPKMKRGDAVTVYAEVIAGEGQTVYTALGMEL